MELSVCKNEDGGTGTSASSDFISESCLIRGQSNGLEFRMVQSNKGKQSLVRNGFMYRLDHMGKDRISWRCSTRMCTAQVKTDATVETIVQDNEKPHTHEADADKLERQLLRAACKRKAVTEIGKRLQDIITEEMRRLGSAGMSSKDTKFLQLAMYRERRKAFPDRATRHSLAGRREKKERKHHSELSSKSRIAAPDNTLPPHIPNNPNPEDPTVPVFFQPPFDGHFDLLGVEPDTHAFDNQHLPTHHQPFQQMHQQNTPDLAQLSGAQPQQQQRLAHPHQQQQQQPPHQQEHFQTHHQQFQPLKHLIPHQHMLQGLSPAALHSPQMAAPLVVASSSKDGFADSQFRFCARDRICYADIQRLEKMLNDKVSTLAYRRALQENRSRLQGSTVLDVGAGTGVLSHFAMQAGASKVYALEASSLALYAEKIVKENAAGSVINVIQKKIEEVELPAKVDAIVSGWMGPNLLYDSMLPSVIKGRDKFLKQDGELFPCSASLFLAPVTDEEFHERLKSWKQMKTVYGVSMESLVPLTKDSLTVRADSRHLDVESVLAGAVRLCHFDLRTVTLQQIHCIQADFSFRVYSHNTMHGFATWFTVAFPGSVCIDTSPFALKTHWGQTVMYLKSSIAVKQDMEISGSFSMQPSAENHRFWDIEMDFKVNGGKKYKQQWQCTDGLVS